MAKTIDREFLRKLRDELDQYLVEVGDKYGVEITLGNATFTPVRASFKLEIACVSDDGEVHTKEAEDFKRYARQYGLRPDHLGQQFTYSSNTYVLLGCKPRSTRFPIVARRLADGKTYKLPHDMVRFAFDKAAAAK